MISGTSFSWNQARNANKAHAKVQSFKSCLKGAISTGDRRWFFSPVLHPLCIAGYVPTKLIDERICSSMIY